MIKRFSHLESLQTILDQVRIGPMKTEVGNGDKKARRVIEREREP